MRVTQIYIEGQIIDLYKDETINITSSVQNINDLSKTFTDFSQSFSVPASKKNNAIFLHWYENALDNGFNANIRKPASIDIDYIPFRLGLIQLEGANVKDGKPDSYRITFMGNVVTLKDKFGEDKLSDLPYGSDPTFDFTYTGDFVKDTITNSNELAVRFPLIASDRIWQEGTADNRDITTTGGAIYYKELFPALQNKAILDLIGTKYGITFNGNFLTNKRFLNTYTWYKNRKDSSDFTSIVYPLEFNEGAKPFLDNKIYISGEKAQEHAQLSGDNAFQIRGYLTINVNTPSTSQRIIEVFRNGQLYTSITGVGSGSHLLFFPISGSPLVGYDIDIELEVTVRDLLGNTTYDFDLDLEYRYYAGVVTPTAWLETSINFTTSTTQIVMDNKIDFSFLSPDITLAGWLTGIVKQFNLTIIPTAENTFLVEPLKEWYESGGRIDITQYTKSDVVDLTRAKLHQSISFEYEESKSFLNTQFKGLFDRNYGNLKSSFDFDGAPLNIKVPFENLLFSKFTNQDLQVAYSLENAEDATSSYVPKTTFLSLYDEKPCNFYFDNGVTTDLISEYIPFGQDILYNQQTVSQNFGAEQSTLTGEVVGNSIYQMYYEDYLSNLFNPKTRIIKVQAHLPLSKLSMLTLDDAIILRDKMYRINEFKTNLNTGYVDFTLISDHRSIQCGNGDEVFNVAAGNSVFDFQTYSIPVKPIKPTVPVEPYNGGGGYMVLNANSGTDADFVFPTPTPPATITEETNIEFLIFPNSSGQRTNIFRIDYMNPDGTVYCSAEKVFNQEALRKTTTTGTIKTTTFNQQKTVI